MARGRKSNLNETGEMLLTRIVSGAALHVSRGEQTLAHAHYAWKVHIGLDAAVWLESARRVVSPRDAVQVVIVPPGLEHTIGSLGLSLTLLVAPGSRSTPWRTNEAPVVHTGRAAQRIVDASQSWQLESGAHTHAFITELLGFALSPCGPTSIDVRARRALARLGRQPDTPLERLARSEGLSVDRLSHLVVCATGMTLRHHNAWARLTRLLSSNKRFVSVAAAAADAGFADHAHLTRTYRAMLGRLPSEFTQPPDAIEPWSAPALKT